MICAGTALQCFYCVNDGLCGVLWCGGAFANFGKEKASDSLGHTKILKQGWRYLEAWMDFA
jgi:hypothetical protein